MRPLATQALLLGRLHAARADLLGRCTGFKSANVRCLSLVAIVDAGEQLAGIGQRRAGAGLKSQSSGL